jgi:MFS family permease
VQGTSGRQGSGTDIPPGQRSSTSGRYKWVALSNTTLGVTMATIDASIVIISMPAIFRGIHLNPLAPGNVSYLLWMIIGYLLVTAVLVVTLGRLGDIYGRVKIYNLGYVVFTVASIALSLDPLHGSSGAIWLIAWRIVQAFGGAMLMANAAAILTDAFPAKQRGMALGINQICAIAGQLIGLLLGGVLAAWDWRAVFWVNVPIGIFGTIWSYRSLREIATTNKARIDWVGNVTFALGAGLLLVAITYGIQPYGGHATGWTSPFVLGGLSLRDAIRAKNAETLVPAEKWAIPLARALARVHAAGWVHLDVKPANVLFDASGEALLGDFGIARRIGESSPQGSFGYLSPERIGGAPCSPRDDVYGFGRVIEEVLAVSPSDMWRAIADACLVKGGDRPADGAAIEACIMHILSAGK